MLLCAWGLLDQVHTEEIALSLPWGFSGQWLYSKRFCPHSSQPQVSGSMILGLCQRWFEWWHTILNLGIFSCAIQKLIFLNSTHIFELPPTSESVLCPHGAGTLSLDWASLGNTPWFGRLNLSFPSGLSAQVCFLTFSTKEFRCSMQMELLVSSPYTPEFQR